MSSSSLRNRWLSLYSEKKATDDASAIDTKSSDSNVAQKPSSRFTSAPSDDPLASKILRSAKEKDFGNDKASLFDSDKKRPFDATNMPPSTPLSELVPPGWRWPPTFSVLDHKKDKFDKFVVNSSQQQQKMSVSEKAGRLNELRTAAAWNIALAPAKQWPVMMILAYMTGRTPQLFSITMTGAGIISTIKSISALFHGSVFAQLEHSEDLDPIDLRLQKFTYLGAQIISLLIALYKLHWMGLLPTATADWVNTAYSADFEEDVSFIGFS